MTIVSVFSKTFRYMISTLNNGFLFRTCYIFFLQLFREGKLREPDSRIYLTLCSLHLTKYHFYYNNYGFLHLLFYWMIFCLNTMLLTPITGFLWSIWGFRIICITHYGWNDYGNSGNIKPFTARLDKPFWAFLFWPLLE